MGALIRAHDWASTPLGPVEAWPQPLKTAVDIMLGASSPISVCWGPDLVLVYNDDWRVLIGSKHPGALGRPLREVVPEIWGAVGPMLAGVLAGHGSALAEDQLLPLDRSGRIEEAWFSSSSHAIPLEDGSIGGTFNIPVETTARVLAERRRDEAERALRENEERLAAELGDMRRLHEAGTALLAEGDIAALHRQLVETAASLMHAEFASMQMLEPDKDALRLLAHKGFDPASAAKLEWVGRKSSTPCGEALRTGRRCVVPDVEACAFLAGSKELITFREMGIRAVQSTPLRSRDGSMLGMISTHWHKPHEPAERELRTLDLLARQAADLIERTHAEATLRESEKRQMFLLKLGDALRPLGNPDASLGEACRLLAERLNVDRAYYVEVDETAGLARVDRDFVRDGAPSLAGEHRIADFDWSVAILRRGECHVIADTQTSDLVPEAERPASAALQIIACMGAPLIKEGRLVGAFCVTARQPRKWSDDEVALVREVGERIWAAVERARAEAAMRESEGRFRHIVESARDYAIFTMDAEGVVTDWHEGAEAVFGFTADEIVGKDGHILFTPEDRAAGEVEKELETARSEGSAPNIRWHMRKDGGRVFIEGRTVALRNGGGALRGFLKIGQDVTARRRAEQALYESEERFRQFAENSADVLWIADATRESVRIEYLSPAFETVWGEPCHPVMDDIGRFLELVHPDDRARVAGALPHLLNGKAHQEQYRIIRPSDGAVRWILDTGFPVRNAAGEIIRVAGIAQDMTARKQAEDQVREAREQLSALVEGIPQLVWRAVDGGEWTWASPQWTRFTGLGEAASRGLGWLEAVHPDDRERAMAAWGAAEGNKSFDVEYRVCHVGKHHYRWFQTRALPLRSDAGDVVEWFGTSTDIDDLRRLQDQQKVILAELQHRSRNLLAVVRSTAGRTFTPGEEVDEFTGRLAALSRVQGFLAHSESFSVDLGEIVRAEIEAHGDGANVRIEGPTIELPGEKAQPFALAVHELATNAVKYGALSAEAGHLDIIWRIEGADGGTPRLVLDWRETGVSMLPPASGTTAAARRKGYGRELIESALPYQLGAQTSLDFTDVGVRCSIKVPLTVLANSGE